MDAGESYVTVSTMAALRTVFGEYREAVTV
jgi:hypothetical protein